MSDRKITRADLFTTGLEQGTPELRTRHKVEIQNVDYRGFIRRAQVVDQHEVDRMLIAKRITPSQHGAAEAMMERWTLAGGPRSPALEASIQVQKRDGDSAIASRWLAITGPMEALRRGSPQAITITCELIVNGKRVADNELTLCRSGLDVLAQYFGVGLVDPREGWSHRGDSPL
jgi:hypothetical protein